VSWQRGKPTRRRVLALPVLLILAGCAHTAAQPVAAPSTAVPGTPEGVVRGYLAALATNDVSVVATYLTPEYGTLLKHARPRDTVAGITGVSIVETRWDRDGMDPSSVIDYHDVVRITVRFTARITREYRLRSGVNLLRCVLVRRGPVDRWRILSDSPVDDQTVQSQLN
jgi:hypothetical protein